MADINRELEELAELTQRVNDEMRRYGQLTRETAEDRTDAEMKARYGVENFTKATGKGADAVSSLGKAMGSAASAMFQGKKGAGAFNDSVDSMADAAKAASVALLLLGGPLGLVAAAVTASIAALGSYTKAANNMSDQLHKGYQGLAESGAAASDGMTGLFEDAKKLGISMSEISDYTGLIAANANSLALFSGTVFEGRKQFADMGKNMEKFREGLMNAGLSQTEINEGQMAYLRLQSRVGLSQNKTTKDLADGANKYLLEMDGLSKITGETRKGMEDQMEAARSEERFAAKLQELRSQDRVDEAKELEKTNLILASQSKEAAQGFRDLSTGMITTEAAQKANILTQGEAMRQADLMSKGLATAGEAATAIGTAAGKTANALTPLAKAGAAGDVIGDYSGALRLGIAAQNNFAEQIKKAEQEQAKQGATGGKAADAAVQAQTDLKLAQQAANEATERFVLVGIVPATNAMTVLAKTTTGSVDALNKLFGITGGGSAGESEEVKREKRKQSDAELKVAEQAKEAAFKDASMFQKMGIGRTDEQQKAAEQLNKVYEKRTQLEIDLAGGYDANGMPTTGVMSGSGPEAPLAAPETPAAVPKTAPGTPDAAPVKGPSGTEGAPVPTKAADVISFGPDSGSAESFAGLDSKLSDAVIKAAEEYQAATGNKIQLNSAKRDSAKQKELYDAYIAGGRQGMPVAPPGTSLHERGLAVDIQNYRDPAAVAAMNRQGLQQKVPRDPVHFSFAGGGVLQGPESGYKPDVTMHGTEAIIPMKNGAVPVSLNLKEALGSPTFAGYNEYAGLNQGPLSTDIDAVKNIAAAAGAFDKASQTITDPATWKQILSSGLATNYQLGAATLGTKGIEGLGDDIAERLKEIKEQTNVDNTAALKQVSDEFKTAMAQMSQKFAESNTGQNDNAMTGIEILLQELISTTKNSVDVQQKILASSY